MVPSASMQRAIRYVIVGLVVLTVGGCAVLLKALTNATDIEVFSGVTERAAA